MPVFTEYAFTLHVAALDRVNGPEYTVDDVLGVLPSVV
jgi:hypothetical protein